MRNYATISPMFWIRGSGKRLRGHKEAQIVAVYLMSCPGANLVGIYPLSLPVICHQTGLTEAEARNALTMCADEDFAFWDEENELVWVPALAKHQIGEKLSRGKAGKLDNRVHAIKKALVPFKDHEFYERFIERYGSAYQLVEEGASEGLRSPFVPVPVPDLIPEAESSDADPKSEAGSETRLKPADPFGDSLRGRLPTQRQDVARVLSKFNETFGFRIKFKPGDFDAEHIAGAIDTSSEADCMLVLAYAREDGMVSGKLDDKGLKHESIGYIFGNTSAFQRILREANKREGSRRTKISATEAVRKAQGL